MKPGDIVRLKSGGPLMTLTRFTTSSECVCGWFDRKGKIHYSAFIPEILTIKNDDDES
jgi:uncharacterized protein YodC (DUF2158 family)